MRKILCAVMALFTFTALLTGCGKTQSTEFESLEGKRVAVLEGSSSVMYALLNGADVRICSDKKELLNAVKLGDVDCALADERDEGYIKRFQLGIKTLKDPFAQDELRIAAARENKDLIDDINSALGYLKEEKILDKIINGYREEDDYTFEAGTVSEDAKTLTVAVCVQDSIYCYRDENDELRGIEIDIAKAVCSYLGLKCEFRVMEQNELITSAWVGYVHFALGCLTVTSENADICIMSDPYDVCTQIILTD